MAIGKLLVLAGLLVAAIGLLTWWGVPFGRLPGDVLVRRGSFSFYVPITTSIILSVVISLVWTWLKK